MIYLVINADGILGCFTDKEKAQKYAEYYAGEITEFEENPTVPVFDGKLYSVRCDLKTDKVWAYRVPNDRKISEWRIWYPRDLIVSVINTHSEDEAVTIGRNHYEQIRAGKMKVLDLERKTYVVWGGGDWQLRTS